MAGRIHMIEKGILSKPSRPLPTKAGKKPRKPRAIVRSINPELYNKTGRGQRVFDECAHKIGQFALIGPMHIPSKKKK